MGTTCIQKSEMLVVLPRATSFPGSLRDPGNEVKLALAIPGTQAKGKPGDIKQKYSDVCAKT